MQRPEGQTEPRHIAAGWQDIHDRLLEHARVRNGLTDVVDYAKIMSRAYLALADGQVGARAYQRWLREA